MKILLIAFIALFSSTLAYADQCAWITKEQADDAVQMIQFEAFNQEVLEYCEPCGDSSGQILVATKVEAVNVEGEYWEIEINGKGIDLAYSFIRVAADDEWMNLSKLTGCPSEDVSDFLPGDFGKAAKAQKADEGADPTLEEESGAGCAMAGNGALSFQFFALLAFFGFFLRRKFA